MDAEEENTSPSGLATENGGGAFEQKSAGINGSSKCTWRDIDLDLFYFLVESYIL